MNNGRFFTAMPMLQWSVWLSIGVMVAGVWCARGQDVTGGPPGSGDRHPAGDSPRGGTALAG